MVNILWIKGEVGMKVLKYITIVLASISFCLLIFLLVVSKEVNKNISERLGFINKISDEDEAFNINKIDSSIYVENNNRILCDSKYEEEIVNRSENGIFKFLQFKIDDTDSFMLVVYDAKNVKMMVSPSFNTPDNSGKERITAMTERYGALAGINGGGFYDDGKVSKDIPMGYVIKDGEILWNYTNGRKGLIIGFSNDNKLMMLDKVNGEEAVAQGMRDGLEFGPVLMREGVITKDASYPRWSGRASRVVLAQREDGIVLMLATNGGTFGGARMSKILEELQNYGAYNIANLDGGASAQMVVDNKLYTTVTSATGALVKNGRLVVNGWGVFKPEQKN